MFSLISFKNGIAEITKSLICKVPGKQKFARYLVNAASQARAESLTAEANQIGGAAFASKYNVDVEIIVK